MSPLAYLVHLLSFLALSSADRVDHWSVGKGKQLRRALRQTDRHSQTAESGGRSTIVDFSGRHLGFKGTPDAYYNIVEDENHLVALHMKPTQTLKGDGIQLDGIGIFYQGLNILVEHQGDDSLRVSVDGKALGMHRGGQTSTQLYSMVTPAGNIAIFCTASGSKLTIETDLLEMQISGTEAGVQPAFLSFGATLLFPSRQLRGILGEGYNHALAGASRDNPDNNFLISNPGDNQLPGYFPRSSLPIMASGGNLDAAKATRPAQHA